MRTKDEILQTTFGHAYGALHPLMHIVPIELAMGVYAKEQVEENIKGQWKEMIKENPVKVLQYFLTLLGQEIVDTNAGTFELSAEMDINGERYKVSCKAKAKKVKPIRTPNPNECDATEAPTELPKAD